MPGGENTAWGWNCRQPCKTPQTLTLTFRRLVGVFVFVTVLSIITGYYIAQINLAFRFRPTPIPPIRQSPSYSKGNLSHRRFPSSTSSSTSKVPQSTSLPPLLSVSSLEFNDTFFDDVASLFQQSRVDCSALYAGNPESVKRAVSVAKHLAALEEGKDSRKEKGKTRSTPDPRNNTAESELVKEVKTWAGEFHSLSNKWYLEATQNCDQFMRTRGYITSSLTREEEDFPIAFSMLVFKDIEMVERLFRSVYRPQNRYCIHVDAKSEPEFFAAVKAVVECFSENAVLSSRRVDVRWGQYSVLEPEIICMADLWAMDPESNHTTATNNNNNNNNNNNHATNVATTLNTESKSVKMTKKRHRKKWKYFINLTGQEFPLKTNYELVQILKAFKGANNEEGTRKRANTDRWKTKPPFGVLPTKGGVHTALNRATIDYILHNSTGQALLEWIKHQGIPDEGFFATLNYNPQLNIPGTYNGTNMEAVPMFIRYKMWYGVNCSSQQTVRGICILSTGTKIEDRHSVMRYKVWRRSACSSRKKVRDVCILSTGDLKRLGESPYLFANKFYLHQDRIAIGCLEEKIFNDTRDEYLGRKTFSTTFYAEQDFVINRVRG